MAYDLATVTNSGNQLLASVVSDRSSLVIDKIEVSGTQLASSTDLKSMISISNVVKTLSANGYQKKDSSFIISTVLDNSSVKADYKAWVFGIWAHETDIGSPILMSVITSTNSPDTISKGSGTPIDYNYKFITTFSNTSSLTIKMSSDTYATNDTVLHNSGDETATGTKTFQKIKISNDKFPSLVQTDGQYITLDGGNSEIVPADNSKVVHTTGDETIDGKKKFDTDPTDGAGNAYAKTVDVNQQLDKKVNIADMRKPASDVAGIEEVNAKQDKIGYTPADDSKVVHSTDTSNWQKHKLTAGDGSAKLVIAGGEDVNEKLKAIVGTKDTGKLLVDIDAKNNPTGNSLIGEYFCDFDGLVTGYGIGQSGAMWNFTYNGTTTIRKLISSDYFTASGPLPTVDDNIYGASWDGSSSGALQRTDAAVGLKAGINGAQNDFDTRGPWGLMDKTVTDSYGNAFVRVPKFYIRKTQDKSKPLTTWQVSLVKQGDDWYLPNCFYDFHNNKELKYVDVSRYEGSIVSGKLRSRTGVTPTINVDINNFRTAATALNVDGKKGYHLWDVHTLDALQVLFTIEFATLDSQSIMKGVTDNVLAGAESTGAADGVKGSSGNVNHSNGYGSMTYRGIENLYGNLATLTDGLNISNLSLYSCDDATKYASDVFTSPYYKLNYSLHSGSSNITGLGVDKDHPSVEAPTSFNSDSYNTYYHDYGYVNGSGNYVVYISGGWYWYAGGSGLWCWSGVSSSSGAPSYVGSRLLKKAL